MSGHRLEAETHVITGAVGSIQNLIKAVQRTGLELDDMVLQPLASAEAVLTQEERELGGVLVDIGGGTTDVAVFLDGSVWHTAVIGLGGNHISNDIAMCLRTPPAHAEELKIAYGHADPAAVADLAPVDVPTFDRAPGAAGPARLPGPDHPGAPGRDPGLRRQTRSSAAATAACSGPG